MATKTLTNESATFMPQKVDRKKLIDIKKSLTESQQKQQNDAKFKDNASEKDFPVVTIKVPEKEAMPLTNELVEALINVSNQLSRGKAVVISPLNTLLTTQECADMLGMSRPTFVKILEHGDIPFEKVGRHRRILLTDLENYAKQRHAEFIKEFDELSAETNPELTLDNPLIDNK
ncbi:MAG: helix-turn-helix domain-containing protein [Bifidobacterium sp.]|nr:helix-turn-helix domain-containing protein [Bifidobacterium sp.]